MVRGLIFMVFFLMVGITSGQDRYFVTGKITDSEGNPVSKVEIQTEPQQASTLSNADGTYEIGVGKPGFVTFIFSNSEYETERRKVEIIKNATLLNINLRKKTHELKEIIITDNHDVKKIKNIPLTVSVLETKNIKTKVATAADIIGRISGVNVRQNGGLGSESNFSINGMSGKQIRFFLDGIPLENYSSEMNISSVPPSFFSRFEVYKGMIPISLSSDALGGAVNMISRNETKNFMDLSYSIGSFNTHKLAAKAQYSWKNMYLGINAFANHSDNNYLIDAEVLNKDGSSYNAKVRRFHNKFTNYMVRTELGVRNKSWADQAFVSLYTSGNRAEIQHDALAIQPYGEAMMKTGSLGALIRYKKKEIAKNLDAEAYLSANYTFPHLIDTSLNIYNWKGEVIAVRNQGGEISGSGNNLYLKDLQLSGQLNTNWHLSSKVNLMGSFQQSYFHRTGSDETAKAYYNRDYYADPQSVNKTIVGLALKALLWNDRITSLTSGKFFNFNAKGYSRNISGFEENSSKISKLGYGQSFSFQAYEPLVIKTSYEYTVRIPSIFELFGDQMLVLPNLSLLPETSHNINLGFVFRQNTIKAELNGFYRNTDHIIWQRPSSRYFMHQNLNKALSLGLEGEVNYQLTDNIGFNINATYQNIRNRSETDGNERYYNQRIPNIPAFFANAEINYSPKKVLWNSLRFQTWYNMRYVDWFYLFWEGDGDKKEKNTIPSQYSGNLGLSLKQKDGKYAISIECQNIFGQKLYDNFRIQKPGRAFFLTLDFALQ
nr:TonB-dependent receptor [uncultured Chryseobacterium sp.]